MTIGVIWPTRLMCSARSTQHQCRRKQLDSAPRGLAVKTTPKGKLDFHAARVVCVNLLLEDLQISLNDASGKDTTWKITVRSIPYYFNRNFDRTLRSFTLLTLARPPALLPLRPSATARTATMP